MSGAADDTHGTAKMGRPRIEINFGYLDKLCELQCTIKEIASFFDCSEYTIERRVNEHSGMNFAGYFSLKRGRGLISLRRAQFKAAMELQPGMRKHLGINWLGQTDRVHIGQLDAKGNLADPPKNEVTEKIIAILAEEKARIAAGESDVGGRPS